MSDEACSQAWAVNPQGASVGTVLGPLLGQLRGSHGPCPSPDNFPGGSPAFPGHLEGFPGGTPTCRTWLPTSQPCACCPLPTAGCVRHGLGDTPSASLAAGPSWAPAPASLQVAVSLSQPYLGLPPDLQHCQQ